MVDLHPEIGIQTGASLHEQKKKDSALRTLLKFYKLLISRWRQRKNSAAATSDESTPDHNNLQKDHVEEHQAPHDKNLQPIEAGTTDKELEENPEDDGTMHGIHSYRYNGDHSIRGERPTSPGCFFKHRSVDNGFHFNSPLSRHGSRRTSPSPTPATSPLNRINSTRKSIDSNGFQTGSLSRNASKRSPTPIMFSNSTGLVKPPPVEKKLECTLEELCFGCKKKIKITRDVVTRSGQMVQEEELLTIKVKPGWKKGTKITFEGMGNEVPGAQPADIIFVIGEKRHHMFRREGDDLELAVEIPLVKALTGCTIPIPLLGGETMDLTIDDIVRPGDEKVIKGQGMPSKDQGKRGNLKLLFLVEFPTELTNQQRSDILSILKSC